MGKMNELGLARSENEARENSLSNLNVIQSTEEAQEKGRAGGIASGIARRERRRIREIVQAYLEKEDTERGCSIKEAIVAGLASKAQEGNVKAFETLMKYSGEEPDQAILKSKISSY